MCYAIKATLTCAKNARNYALRVKVSLHAMDLFQFALAGQAFPIDGLGKLHKLQ